MRWQVSCSMVCSDAKAWNCFGLSGVDSGHSRVPEPPDMITGAIFG
jgi:hypothetical protein